MTWQFLNNPGIRRQYCYFLHKQLQKTWALLCRISNFGGILAIFDLRSAHWHHSVQKRAASKTRTMTVNGNTCMKYIRRQLMFHVSQIPNHIDLNFTRLSWVLLQLFDTNTHTHLIYRKEEAWSRHDTLEVKLQAQRHCTRVPLCIAKARIIFKFIC